MSDLDEIKKYLELRDDYYQSSKLTTGFDVQLFHKLSAKYDPIDVTGFLMDQCLNLRAENERLKIECSSMGRVLSSGVVVPTDEYGALIEERDRLKALVELADQVLLLTHPELSNVEMNTLTTRQYMIWQKAKKELEGE